MHKHLCSANCTFCIIELYFILSLCHVLYTIAGPLQLQIVFKLCWWLGICSCLVVFYNIILKWLNAKHRLGLVHSTGIEPESSCIQLRLEATMYYYTLSLWRQYFPRKQILVIRTKDLKADQTDIVALLYRFLGLSSLNE